MKTLSDQEYQNLLKNFSVVKDELAAKGFDQSHSSLDSTGPGAVFFVLDNDTKMYEPSVIKNGKIEPLK